MALWLVFVTSPPASRLPVISIATIKVRSFLIGYDLNLDYRRNMDTGTKSPRLHLILY